MMMRQMINDKYSGGELVTLKAKYMYCGGGGNNDEILLQNICIAMYSNVQFIAKYIYDGSGGSDEILLQQCCESATPGNHPADQLKREPQQVFLNEDDHHMIPR